MILDELLLSCLLLGANCCKHGKQAAVHRQCFRVLEQQVWWWTFVVYERSRVIVQQIYDANDCCSSLEKSGALGGTPNCGGVYNSNVCLAGPEPPLERSVAMLVNRAFSEQLAVFDQQRLRDPSWLKRM